MAISSGIPAAAEYAASAAPVLPLDVAMIRRLPWASASETATTPKRSLYEPDGFVVSSLKYSSGMPALGPIERDLRSGVFPSPNVTRADTGIGGNISVQRQMLIAPSPSCWR